MKKDILIRATPSPLESISAKDAWRLNAYHNNSGNVAFPFGLFRNLMTEEVDVVSDWYGSRLPEPAEVNERYSMYVLPMANDFGGHFASEMQQLTKFINQLTIPVVVVGIGGAFSANPDFSGSRPFDRVTKQFVNAVLERSSMIGLRGHITADYLHALGYREDHHYKVIGDPTLYNLGSKLRIRDFKFSDDIKIAYNMTPKAPQSALAFLNRIPQRFPSAVYVPQDMGEFSKIYAGMMDVTANPLRDRIDNFPSSLSDAPYRTGNIKFFLNAPKWIEFMEGVDLSIGTRIHGNVLPTHAGTPSLTMMYGSRLTELAEYHHLPRVNAADVNADTSLQELTEGVDFKEPERFHAANFDNYVRFLDSNGINHSYRLIDGGVTLPFDRKLAGMELPDAITPITVLTDSRAILERISDGYEISKSKVIAQKDRLDRLVQEVRALRKFKANAEARSRKAASGDFEGRLSALESQVRRLLGES